jgi:hypothetical protein
MCHYESFERGEGKDEEEIKKEKEKNLLAFIVVPKSSSRRKRRSLYRNPRSNARGHIRDE